MGVGCGLVVHGGEQPVTLLGLGLPEETPVVTVDEQPEGTHSRWGCKERCVLVAMKET